ncbi:glycerol kinase GlpK [Lentisphaerota bacterium ZTH]|nr:glycerol kinase GlpK [Lentisphaerota bacterium]WET07703.1 glycerol kinase GlpK [Lentisphaerota bacterium ZTH]
MAEKYVLALDQGTTSSRAIIFDRHGNIIEVSQREFTQIYPQAGWVEHKPQEIWASQSSVMTEVMAKASLHPEDIACIGITNQRETTIIWDRHTGRPVYNAIVWQCRRTAEECEKLVERGLDDYVRDNTGLLLDAYFSGTKIKWILDNVDGAREKARNGDLLFGTVDAWLVWNLTQGEVHVTDYTNASRTMIYNIHELDWDQRMLDELDIPRAMLPEVKPSSCIYGHVNLGGRGGHRIPIAGIAGDQQSALFGQACFHKGMAKNTYGTGCFMLMNTGEDKIRSHNGLLTTLLASGGKKPHYALEGSVFMGGATIQWLRDELKIIHDARDVEYFSRKVKDTGGVYLVPAFVGLGAPYWDMYARGTIIGMTRGTNRNHIIRAAVESIAYQSRDMLEAMQEDAGIKIHDLKVDGGAVRDGFLMQFQADLLGVNVERPLMTETTAWGAASLAGLATGYWKDFDDISRNRKVERIFKPEMPEAERIRVYSGWKKAVERSRNWALD